MNVKVDCGASGQVCRQRGTVRLKPFGSALCEDLPPLIERLEARPVLHPPPDADGAPTDV
jgi:hypothetical protein